MTIGQLKKFIADLPDDDDFYVREGGDRNSYRTVAALTKEQEADEDHQDFVIELKPDDE